VNVPNVTNNRSGFAASSSSSGAHSDSSTHDPGNAESRTGAGTGTGTGKGTESQETITINGIEYPAADTHCDIHKVSSVVDQNECKSSDPHTDTDTDTYQKENVANDARKVVTFAPEHPKIKIEEHRRHKADHLFAEKRKLDQAAAAEDAKAEADAAQSAAADKAEKLSEYERMKKARLERLRQVNSES
jgi:hypothetical protein